MQGDLFSNSIIKKKYDSIFAEAYKKLNPKQKEAVDQIEGPVMVNAGPGTGKTQILATRIGKILTEQDVQPHNILCLTFTDAASIAMRTRLVEIVGPVAHKIHIYTFHSFCNQVIQENLEYFGGYRKLEPISDLEQVDVLRNLIDNLDDDNILKRFKGDKYLESAKFRNLYDLMKKENLDEAGVNELIDDHLLRLKEGEQYIAKRKVSLKSGKVYEKGDFREDKFQVVIDKFKNTREAAAQFKFYKELFEEKERYDYADMILWVIKAFSENEMLLSDYQERYQYFLVDEYQDTNGAQNEILTFLISYWDKANVFVVGDDDQAIYKFQGANLGNIKDFKEKYQPYTVVLEENYRSNQPILDISKHLISLNSERIINDDPNLSKELIASGEYKKNKNIPEILGFDKISVEYAYIAQQLEELYKSNPAEFNEVAVIYRNHKQVTDLVNVLEKRNVPFNIKKKVNILELPVVKNLLNILNYVNEEYKRLGGGKGYIFEVLHYNYFKVDSIDIGKIALYCQRKNEEGHYSEWRTTISDEKVVSTLNLRDPEAILNTARQLDKWIKEVKEITLQNLFENIINDGGVLHYIMTQQNKSWLLQVVSTFFEFIKAETARDPELTLDGLLQIFPKMIENNIALPINKIISSEDGVNFITAHSAKGLEFKQVFIIGATSDIWDKSPSTYNQFPYPDNINADSKVNDEDERRLFYVAMTRAKTNLTISYSRFKEEGKALGPSKFVDEIVSLTDYKIKSPDVDENTVAEFYFNLLKREDKTIPLIEKDLIRNWIKGYRMSVTHLNKYLRCPISFYFESILRVPHARNAYAGFGSAMHDALHHYFEGINNTKDSNVNKLIFFFNESMLKHKSHFTTEEFKSYSTHGERTLRALHENRISEWSKTQKFAVEEELSHAEYEGVPIKGFLDKVEIHKDFVHVVDYKTGNPNSYKTKAKLKGPSEKNENGGDYWRQLVFYKILTNSDKKHEWNMVSGEIDFIEPDRKTGEFSNYKMVVTDEDIDKVGEQILETYKKIENLEFDKTCDDDECMWCNFVKDNYNLNPELKETEHEYA